MSRLSRIVRRRNVTPRVELLEGREVPAVFTVTTVSDNPADPGLTLREAITAANALAGPDSIEFQVPSGSTIVIDPNALDGGESQGAFPTITDDLTITGPGKTALAVSGNNLVAIFRTATNVPLAISGLTLTKGNALDGFGGGAIFAKGTLQLNGVTFLANTAPVSSDGGAISSSSSVFLDDVLFDSNQAGINGGAIAFRNLTNSSVSITDISGPVVFANNKAGGEGGALFLADADFFATGVRFESNSASFRGGAIMSGSSLIPGGSIALNAASFVGNASNSGGGAATFYNVAGTISNSTFSKNQAVSSSGGGALEVRQTGMSGALLAITNSTFSQNQAGSGGAISLDSESANAPILSLTHVTITNNQSFSGGGIHNASGTPTVSLLNSIVAGNFDSMALTLSDVSGPVVSLGTNLISTTSGATGFVASDIVNANPLLGPLANNGGPTATILPQAGSPALGKANPSGASSADQRGLPRPSAGEYDIGAVQLQRPTATDDVFSVNGIVPTNVPAPGVLGNDKSNDVSPGLTATLLTPPPVSFGGVNLLSDGSFTFTPASGAAGSAVFTYSVTDGLTKSTATVTLNIPAVIPPTANDDAFALPNLPPNGSTVVAPGVLGNDTPGNGPGPLTAVLVSQTPPSFGSVSLAADGSLLFTPAPGAFGSGSFTYRASDGMSQSAPATVTLTLPFVPPTANDDAFALPNLPPNGSIVIAPGVLGNDVQNDAFPLTAILSSQPPASFGSVSLAADGSILFTPAPGAFGSGTFTYRATDGKTVSALATVTLTLPFVPPTANNDSFALPNIPPGTSTVIAPGVLGNDVQNDAFPLTAMILSQPAATFGSVSLASDGSLIFTPAAGAFGSGSFTYQATDGKTVSTPATVTLTLPFVPPTANDDAFALPNLPPGTSTVIAPGVLGNDVQNDAFPLTAILSSQPPASFGSVSLAADGSILFTPAPGAFGSGSFTYRATDGKTVSASATVTLTLPFVPPTANDDSFNLPNIPPGTSTVIAPGVLGNDVPNDAFPLTAAILTQPATTFGNVTLASDGSFIFTPAVGAFGSGTFTYQATDGKTQSTPATVTLTLPFVPPTANNDTFTLANPAPGQSVVVAPGVLANDSLNDAFSPLTAILDAQPPTTFGTVALNANGSFVFTPAIGATGTGTFTYRASDGVSTSAAATVTLTLPITAPPVVNLTAVGAGAGVAPRVRVFNTDGSVRFNFLAFEPSFLGGVRVAVGDATGDGTDDIFAVAGTGGGPRVALFDGLTGARIADFFAFEPEFRGGLHVAAADTDGDGRVEVVVGAGSTPTFSGGPRVSAINPLTLTRTADFFAFDESFRGGVRVAAADLDSDGVAEIVAVAGPSGGPHVRVFTGAGADRGSFFAFDQAYRGGAFLAASAGRIFVAPDSVPTSAGTVYGDFFDSFPDTGGTLPGGNATGRNVSSRPHVYVFDAPTGVPASTPSQVVDLFEPTFLGGVRISVGESNGQTGLYAAAGSGGNGRVRFFPLGNALATNPLFEFTGLDNLGTASVYVGGSAKGDFTA